MTQIRALATALREQNGTCDPFALCEALGIAVLFTDLPSITKGVFFVLQGKKIINLRQNLPEEERRAVCAHELGHALLHPTANTPFLAANTRFVMGRYEREADYFSACLLLDDWGDSLEDYTLEQLAAERQLPLPTVELWAQINQEESPRPMGEGTPC